MNKVEMLTKLNCKITRLKMKGRKYSPEILLVLGIAGAVTGTVLACVATTKLPEVKQKKNDDLDGMHTLYTTNDNDEDVALQAIKRRTTEIYLKTGVKYVGLYAPAVLVTGVSLSCLVFSNVILRRRLIGVTAAYATISASFKEYRGRVAERYGDDIEKEIRYNIKSQEITTTTMDSKGKEKNKTDKIKVMDPNGLSDFARMYNEGCISWCKDPQANLNFLKCQETAATKRLQKQGYLFLNEVYEMLGFPRIPEGQVAGWIYDEKNPIGDNFVDFGIYNTNRESSINFVNGYDRTIILDFNIDGNIIDLM